MPEYESLAELRTELNDKNLDAALDVREAGLDTDEVTGSDPPVDELVSAGLIPEGSGPGKPVREHYQRVEELLERIATAVEGGGSA